MKRVERTARQIAILEASRVIYRKLRIHPSAAYAVARELDRQELLATMTVRDVVNLFRSTGDGLLTDLGLSDAAPTP